MGIEGDSWFRYTDPYCSNGQIELGNFWIRGAYTDPAYVYVGTTVYYWDDRRGGFQPGQSNEFISHGYWTVPNDGQFYVVNAGTWQRRAFGTSLHQHHVFWWNGFQWVDWTEYPVQYYFGAVTGLLRLCNT